MYHHMTLFLLFCLIHTSTSTPGLKNVTEAIFGSDKTDLEVLPMAFGDFNSDKLTDMFVVSANDKSKLTVYLAKEQSFSLQEENYFVTFQEARKSHLTCSLQSHMDILGVAPADFDGDGGMDVAVVIKEGQKFNVYPTVIICGILITLKVYR